MLASPKDACEMLFCTTKQKKRKGVPYCGTCRKFMEETVKWYCDTYRVHPAKEKEKFVPAVRNERYGCRHPKVPVPSLLPSLSFPYRSLSLSSSFCLSRPPPPLSLSLLYIHAS